MMESEFKLQSALNELGAEATGECLKRFDTDGAKIEIGGCKFTSKGAQPKTNQTPYGEARIDRHVYQGAVGAAPPSARWSATRGLCARQHRCSPGR